MGFMTVPPGKIRMRWMKRSARGTSPPAKDKAKFPAPPPAWDLERTGYTLFAMRSAPLVLGIETSCDDTACAVLDGDGRVLSSVVSSQLAAHRPYGGVVPEIASREHLANWPVVSREALDRAGVPLTEIDVVAATRGPGLVGALLVGLSIGKAIAFAGGRPFHAVHHLEGHLFSPFLRPPGDPDPPEPPPSRFVGLVLSGGHSSLFAVE